MLLETIAATIKREVVDDAYRDTDARLVDAVRQDEHLAGRPGEEQRQDRDAGG